MYQDTITLFNRYITSDKKIYWYPTILKNVNLNIDKASILTKYGAESKDNAILNVRYTRSGNSIHIREKKYFLPKEWQRLSEGLSNALTFTGTQQFDFFYAGEWENENPIPNEDYADGFYAYMNKTYDQVFAITSVSKFSLIPHFEVTAK